MSRRFRALLVPAVALMAGACFATRNDVRTLQSDIAVLRAENARSDSVHRSQFQQAALAVRAVADSMRSMNALIARFSADVARFQGDLAITMHTFGTQLVTLQELAGQNQRQLQTVKAQLDRDQADLANSATPSTASPSSAGSVPGGQPANPNGLFATGLALLEKGAGATARAVFQDFLAQAPNNENAGEAQFGIARSYDLDGNAAAADSAYALVVQKYPKTLHASTALYKRALAARLSGRPAIAKQLFQQVVDQYPKSIEALSAADALKKP